MIKKTKRTKIPKVKKTWLQIYDKFAHKYIKPEERLSIDVAFYLNTEHPDLLWWHTPNEGRRGWMVQVLAILLGVRAGVPDIFIARATKTKEKYNGFFCELKVLPNRPNTAQQDVMIKLLKEGYYCCVANTQTEFIKELENYLNGT